MPQILNDCAQHNEIDSKWVCMLLIDSDEAIDFSIEKYHKRLILIVVP